MEAYSHIKQPFFSVVITTYNRAHLLIRALQSLLSQTENDWEAIIIDDGSKDNTEQQILPLLKEFQKINYFKQRSSGAVVAKNTGISFTTGQYITFLDSDDEYQPNHLYSRKKILLENNQVDFLHGGTRIIGNPYVPDRNNYRRQVHLNECAIGGTFFIKKSLMSQLKSFREIPLGSDADFLERCKLSGANISTTGIPTYIYHREHPNSITGNLSLQTTIL
jgi:glycosyltransferase involved in cell wall biosynthesis